MDGGRTRAAGAEPVEVELSSLGEDRTEGGAGLVVVGAREFGGHDAGAASAIVPAHRTRMRSQELTHGADPGIQIELEAGPGAADGVLRTDLLALAIGPLAPGSYHARPELHPIDGTGTQAPWPVARGFKGAKVRTLMSWARAKSVRSAIAGSMASAGNGADRSRPRTALACLRVKDDQESVRPS